MFLGRAAREGLEPVGVVVGAVLQGPLPHAGGYAVGDFGWQRRAVLHGVDERIERFLVQVFAHGVAPEYPGAEVVRGAACRDVDLRCRVVDGRIDHLESE